MENKMIVKEYVFQKKDGDIRILRGTKSISGFKKHYPTAWDSMKPSTDKKSSEDVITLIDLDLKEWRSIRPESIISVRTVKDFEPKFHFADNDGYSNRVYSKVSNYIKRGKIPYQVLMYISSHDKGIVRSDIENTVDFIATNQNRDLRVRGKGLRAIGRAVRLFVNNAFIKLDKSGFYKITDKGRNLLETGVM